ncbi:glycerol-3-phosphate acyltransferase 1, mitochondrial isoform X2 [Daktulosphaira vitifoliae]|uniref:glycerol-3-phosphate acyltransferase 1, mitochondrial isoform X2 n=1 Tax=Daktulosphaira vitifoliae TaxID=58002 RepID=UPI0021AA3D41|nr:glycerol-3-phosphate acyltransferase 1, mitochondrial isoform X2 [Daktulosphaira vitifoliae]
MVKAISSRFQDIYKKYTTSEIANTSSNNQQEIYIAPVNTINVALPRQHRSKSKRVFIFDTKQLCQAKEVRWPILREKKIRPFVGQCCSVCIPYTATGHLKVESNLKNLLDIYSVGCFQKSYLGPQYDVFKFFYSLKAQEYKYIFDEVLNDESVRKTIEELSRKKCSSILYDNSALNKEIKLLKEKSKNILEVMSSKIKNWVYKVMAWFVFCSLSRLTKSLVVQPSQIEKVKEAEQSGLPIIYLPLHKSHMDYILLGLVLTMYNIKPPLVAAGDNLRVFFFSKLLSCLGAFYIKRKLPTKDNTKDLLYWSILTSYIKNSLRSEHHLEFFLEGARTRSGKCCVPKGGLLSIIVDAYRQGVIEDAWIIPVSINYDRLFEGDFVREQLGQPKVKETFYSAVSTFLGALCSQYGIMRVDFNIPYRLRDLYESTDKRIVFENITDVENDISMFESSRYKYVVDEMAKHIIIDCWKTTAIMSTNAVSFLLLKKYRNGTTISQLSKELTNLRHKLAQSNRDIGFSGSSRDVILYTINLLAPKLLVCENIKSEIFIKPVNSVNSLIELSYYANNLLSHYLHQSLVAIVLSYLVGSEFWNLTVSEVLVSRQILIDWLLWFIDLLKYDFVFIKPCENIDNLVDSVMRIFEEEEIIITLELLDEERRGRNMAKFFESDSEDDFDQPTVDFKYHVY